MFLRSKHLVWFHFNLVWSFELPKLSRVTNFKLKQLWATPTFNILTPKNIIINKSTKQAYHPFCAPSHIVGKRLLIFCASSLTRSCSFGNSATSLNNSDSLLKREDKSQKDKKHEKRLLESKTILQHIKSSVCVLR